MKVRTVHVNNFGNFAPPGSDYQGYITYHDDPRYEEATDAQLQQWLNSNVPLVQAAVRVERANRAIQRWRENSKS